MKKLLVVLGVVVGMACAGGTARAHDAYNDAYSHPLLLASYPVHAVGWTLEWLVMRPIHFFVSQPDMVPIFGHEPQDDPFGNYPSYDPVDSPE
ncbi:MAG: hypothetical protein KIT14_02290 [bacterium]|nr:hypothetical protein [bacterium]